VIRYLDELPASADLVVIGGGVVGAATAFHCARAGLQVVLIEARPRLCTLTTPVAAGAFRLQFDDREQLEGVRASVDMFLNFQELTAQREYALDVQQRGYLFLARTETTADRQRADVERLHAWGQTDVEIVPGDDARDRWPWLGSDVIQARWRAADGFIDTKLLTHGLVAGSGAGVITACAATGFKLQGDRIEAVATSGGTVACAGAVVCAGPLSGRLLRDSGIALPLKAVRRHKLILPHVPEVPPDAPMTIDEETSAHWRPAYGRGAWLLHTDPLTPPSEPTMDVPTDHRFAFGLLDPDSPHAVSRTVPFWREVWDRGSDHWLLQAGQYVVTPDFRPVIGQTRVKGLFVNTGYSGHGIMLSPSASRFVSESITSSSPIPNPFDPLRPFRERLHPTL
jgi:sarcosine oxidase subunit beta